MTGSTMEAPPLALTGSAEHRHFCPTHGATYLCEDGTHLLGNYQDVRECELCTAARSHVHTCPVCLGDFPCTDPDHCVSPREIECAGCISSEGVLVMAPVRGALS